MAVCISVENFIMGVRMGKSEKAILHIGSSYHQVNSIKWAQELGIKVISTDKNYDAPARKLVDRFHRIDATNIDALLRLAEDIDCNYKLIGVYAGNELSIKAMVAIQESFGLVSPNRSAVETSINKKKFKAAWIKAGIPTPRYIVRDISKMVNKEVVREIGDFPLIIKPVDIFTWGSLGVKLVNKIEELNKSMKDVSKYSQSILLEKYHRGSSVKVFGLIFDKTFYPCDIIDCDFDQTDYFMKGAFCPSLLENHEKNKCFEVTEKAARVLGLDNSPICADLINTNNGPVILEITPLFGLDARLIIHLASGVNPIKAYFAYLSGSENFEKYLLNKSCKKSGWKAIFPQVSGFVSNISGIESATSIPGIKGVYIGIKKNSYIEPKIDNYGILGIVWGAYDTFSELDKKLNEAKSKILIKVQQKY